MSEHDSRLPAFSDLPAVKEKAIDFMTESFSRGLISMEQFEISVGLIQHSDDPDAIRQEMLKHQGAQIPEAAATRDLSVNSHESIELSHSSRIVGDKILLAKTTNVKIMHSNLILDYRKLSIPDGTYEIIVDSANSNCHIKIPDGVIIENRIKQDASNISSPRVRNENTGAAVVFKISGSASHSNIYISYPGRLLKFLKNLFK